MIGSLNADGKLEDSEHGETESGEFRNLSNATFSHFEPRFIALNIRSEYSWLLVLFTPPFCGACILQLRG